MPDANGGQIEGWPDGELRATVGAYLGVGADADLPDDLRFLIGVGRTVRARQREAGMEGEQTPSLFLLCAKPTGIPPAELAKRPMLDNGQSELGGSFWFVSPAVVNAQQLAVDNWSDEAIFSKVTEELDLGSAPAVYFDTRTSPPSLRHYPNGLGTPDDVSISRMGGERLDIDRVLEIVNEAHLAHLATPHGGAKLWKSAKKYWASKEAEKKVQYTLRLALHHELPTATIRLEQPGMVGRLDLEIEEPLFAEGTFVRHAILELKILRSFGSSGRKVSDQENRLAVKDGVSQAASYKAIRGAKAAALCCFDMRKTFTDQGCFRGFNAEAKRKEVRLRAWHIYASAAELRSAEPAKAVAAALRIP